MLRAIVPLWSRATPLWQARSFPQYSTAPPGVAFAPHKRPPSHGTLDVLGCATGLFDFVADTGDFRQQILAKFSVTNQWLVAIVHQALSRRLCEEAVVEAGAGDRPGRKPSPPHRHPRALPGRPILGPGFFTTSEG